MRLNQRASGVLMPMPSLAGPHGCGDLGDVAHQFARFLATAGQRWWQILPIGPPGFGDSPYQPTSAFAGSPLLIALEPLVRDGLLSRQSLDPLPPRKQTHYGVAKSYREPRLRTAFDALDRRKHVDIAQKFAGYCARQETWLSDFALFCALKDAHDGAAWTTWAPELRARRKPALERAQSQLSAEIRYHMFLQFVFDHQWSSLRAQCKRLGVGLIGDAPMFVAHDSADVWAHPELFHLNATGACTVIAGVPPDCFSKTGQIWGNPLYRWSVLREQNYAWWIERLRLLLSRVDAVRLDHFIGFHRFWAVPADARTALHGRWLAGPGADFFQALFQALPEAQLVVEDLGLVTPQVEELRDQFGLPGMRVLQFGFGGDAASAYHLPHNYSRKSVVYTGTHDNDTVQGWLKSGGRHLRTQVARYVGNDQDLGRSLVRLALASVADTAIIPLQDLLGLGSFARINIPGVATGGWRWRVAADALSAKLAQELNCLTHTYGR